MFAGVHASELDHEIEDRRRSLTALNQQEFAANPARHFYEACGGVRLGQGPVTVGDRTLVRVAYSWASSLPLPL